MTYKVMLPLWLLQLMRNKRNLFQYQIYRSLFMKLINTSPPLLSREQAAKYLGVKSATMACWSCCGRYDLPVVKIGRLSKYRQQDLDDFITRNTIGGETLQ